MCCWPLAVLLLPAHRVLRQPVVRLLPGVVLAEQSASCKAALPLWPLVADATSTQATLYASRCQAVAGHLTVPHLALMPSLAAATCTHTSLLQVRQPAAGPGGGCGSLVLPADCARAGLHAQVQNHSLVLACGVTTVTLV